MAALTAKTSKDQKAVTPLRMVVMSAMLAMVQAMSAIADGRMMKYRRERKGVRKSAEWHESKLELTLLNVCVSQTRRILLRKGGATDGASLSHRSSDPNKSSADAFPQSDRGQLPWLRGRYSGDFCACGAAARYVANP